MRISDWSSDVCSSDLDAELVAFSKRFGVLDIAPPNENGTLDVPGYPEVLVISNVKENGKPIGSLGNAEAIWHTDMNYIAEPPTASCLYALEVPPSGGDTGFSNMYRALEEMPQDLLRRIAGQIGRASCRELGGQDV